MASILLKKSHWNNFNLTTQLYMIYICSYYCSRQYVSFLQSKNIFLPFNDNLVISDFITAGGGLNLLQKESLFSYPSQPPNLNDLNTIWWKKKQAEILKTSGTGMFGGKLISQFLIGRKSLVATSGWLWTLHLLFQKLRFTATIIHLSFIFRFYSKMQRLNFKAEISFIF